MTTFQKEGETLEKMKDVFLIVICILILIKTFFYLRIFQDMSYIVTMIRTVLHDLKIFMTFYFILILMFSAILSILKVGNYELSHDPATR